MVKKTLIPALSILLMLAGCSGSDPDPEPTETHEGVIVVPTETPEPTAEPREETEDKSGSDEHDLSIPDGMTQDEIIENREDAFKSASYFWDAYNSVNGGERADWLKEVDDFSTSDQKARNEEEANSYEFARDSQWLEEANAECETVTWLDEAWIVDGETLSKTEMTVAIPARVQCLDDSMSESVQQHNKLNWQSSTGLTGDGVKAVPFEMKQIDGQWFVNNFDHLDPAVLW